MKSGYRSRINAYHRLHVPKYWPWVASHLRLPHHDSTLNRDALSPAYRQIVSDTLLLSYNQLMSATLLLS
jgi:hypothetical protein